MRKAAKNKGGHRFKLVAENKEKENGIARNNKPIMVTR